MDEFKKGDRIVAMWPKNEGGFKEAGTFIKRFKHPYRSLGYDDCASFTVDELATDEDPNDDGYREIEYKYLKKYELSDESEFD